VSVFDPDNENQKLLNTINGVQGTPKIDLKPPKKEVDQEELDANIRDVLNQLNAVAQPTQLNNKG
jgi:hypothetical protein